MSAMSSRQTVRSTGPPEGHAQRRQRKAASPGKGTIILPHSAPLASKTITFRGVAAGLRPRGFEIAPLQLLSPEETAHGYHLFDIDLLARRIIDAIANLEGTPVGLFGENLDAAAILAAAAASDCAVHALVLCNARPDLVPDAPPAIRAPTLCIVAEEESLVLELNRKALAQLGEPGELATLPPGQSLNSPATAARVAKLAAAWFSRHLPAIPATDR